MSWRFRVPVTFTVAAACLVLLQAGAIHAQGRQFPRQGNQRQQGQMRNLPQLEIQGTVDIVAINAMKITTDSKQTWVLRLSPETRVEIKGNANLAMLSHGTYVSFVAEVNQKTSRVEEKVGQLAIFVPSNRMPVGAVPEGAAGAGGAFGLNVGADQPFGGPAAGAGGRGAARGAGKSAVKATESFDIKGQITSIKGDKITLLVPNQYFKRSLRIELTENPEVTLDVNAPLVNCPPLPSLVKQGDRVEVKGHQVAESMGTVAELRILMGDAGAEETPKKGPGKAGPATKDAPKGRAKPAKDAADSEDSASPKSKKGAKKTADKSKDNDSKE